MPGKNKYMPGYVIVHNMFVLSTIALELKERLWETAKDHYLELI